MGPVWPVQQEGSAGAASISSMKEVGSGVRQLARNILIL